MKAIRIHPADSVAVALCPLHKGESISIEGVGNIVVNHDIAQGHKFLLNDMSAGADVIKYGYPIGHLTEKRHKGDLIDHSTLHTNLSGTLDYTYQPQLQPANTRPLADFPDTFMGYRRKNGDVGIRNELWIVPTVGCVNGVCQQLKEEFSASITDLKDEADVLHVMCFPHNYGCSQLSDDHESTRLILRDLVLHPNAGGVLIVGLGCENNQPDDFMQLLGNYDTSRIRLLVTQRIDGDEIEEGLKMLNEIYEVMSHDRRTPVPVSELRIGLKCGGSDGLSGITANPLLGQLSDSLVAKGGTTVLTEVPEMFGSETILMNRCTTPELFAQTVAMVNGFKQYFLSHGEPVGENPSPGNKAGGISTLEEKALGCTQKAGTANVCGVLTYADRLQARGLNLLCAPGNDLVASTALAAAGCHMVLFTTGRGTPFGTFVPTLKISTNSTLAHRKPNWIDFNAGVLTEGTSMTNLLQDFISKVISTASGTPILPTSCSIAT